MSHLWYATIVFVTLIFSVKSSCYLPDEKFAECSTLNDIAVHGTTNWGYFIAENFDNEPITILKANSFRQTPNLNDITIRGVINNIEINAFNGLKRLNTLSFEKNELREIPIGLFSNISINRLDFHGCSIRHLEPGCFHEILNLKSIIITDNFLVNIPTGIFNGLNLERLSLLFNEIKTIESNAFANMENLIYLALNGNKLTTFDSTSIIGNSPSLLWLFLNQNLITKVTSAMFLGLPNLQMISVGANHIDNVESQSLKNMTHLMSLDLSGNRLEVLEPNIFPSFGLQNLTKLYIHSNNLTFLSPEVLNLMPNLMDIALSRNPWQCPCLAHVLTWMANNKITNSCDKDYFLEMRPVCLFSSTNSKDCVYNTESNREIISNFTTVLAGNTEKLICVP